MNWLRSRPFSHVLHGNLHRLILVIAWWQASLVGLSKVKAQVMPTAIFCINSLFYMLFIFIC
jgi:hypothetical protein